MTDQSAVMQQAPAPTTVKKSPRLLWALGLSAALLVLSVASLLFGVREIPLSSLLASATAFDISNADHIVLIEMRIPRLIAALLVGSSLAMAGAIMQIVTRNPLADPGLFGINAGASIAVVISVWILGMSAASLFVWPALIGSFIVSILVYALAAVGSGGANPLRMALAGAAVSAFLLALVRGILLISQQTLDVYRFWVVGSLHGIELEQITQLWPFFATGFVLCLFLGRMLNALSLGDDLAKSLGTHIGVVKALSLLAIVCLCGASVALAGPIAFIGLIIPHIARRVAGADSQWLLLQSALMGALLVMLGDVAGRLIIDGSEIQIGVMVAIIGGPFFVYLVRQTRMMMP